HEGNPYIVLVDPLRLSEEIAAIPQQLVPFLELCDGTRDLPTLRTAFELQTGVRLDEMTVAQIVSQLDEALLLDNGKFAQVRDALTSEFKAAPARPPTLAGASYPADPDELTKMLEGYLDSIPKESNPPNNTDGFTGIISPHIDFQRGGPVYAQTWNRISETIRDIDLAIIFGTNHLGGYNLFTLTRQNYSTPWGILPTPENMVDQLADGLGNGIAFEDELYHQNEHSIELALVWLHYFLGDRKCELLPILCGSFERFTNGGEDPAQNEEISAVLNILQEVTKSRRTLIVAAADLAHMGPAFGDLIPIDTTSRAKIAAADEDLMKSMCAADAQGFFTQIKQEGDNRRICGLAPIYMTLRILEQSRGEPSGYMQCPADEIDASLVSICGIGLR
ncbi:MAG: AmmeMemoRadiSam system protein B, partial [Chloroflexi bacterium]|nr:AmmeMemoRadiSam system protein B [Chloroflexota bacterium]